MSVAVLFIFFVFGGLTAMLLKLGLDIYVDGRIERELDRRKR